MNLSVQRRTILERHAALTARHRELTGASSQLHELREHHEELQEHHAALAAYETAVAELSPTDRVKLTLATTLEAAETMLVEAARAVDQARDAWRQATAVYQKVRNMLDREE